MSITSIYNLLDEITADYTETTFVVNPQEITVIGGEKDVRINKGYGRSEERVILSDKSRFWLKLQWKVLSEADQNTIFDFFHDPKKGCGIGRSWYFTPPEQHLAAGHDLTCRFDCQLGSFLQNYKIYGIASLTLAILGKKSAV